jgi:hypothetical protein
MNVRLMHTAILTAALTTLTGCTSLTQVRFTVEPSSLDYAQFRASRPSTKGEAPTVIKLELAGSGYLEYRSGRSERVRDGFWQESESPDWQDLRKDHLVLTQDETVAIYQRLVDAGIFDTLKREKPSNSPSALAVLLNIRFRKKVILTNDPVYIQIFEELLARFEP